MIKVIQRVVDPGKGDCMRAALCSLLEVEDTNVPNFLECGNRWYSEVVSFLNLHGYEFGKVLHNKKWVQLCQSKGNRECFEKVDFLRECMLNTDNLQKLESVGGYYYASVLSPKYWDLWDGFLNTHAVLVDINLRVVWDPNPEYKKLLQYPLKNLIGRNGIVDVTEIRKMSVL